MIKDKITWQQWEKAYLRKKHPDFEENLTIFEAMYEEARWLKILPEKNPLIGLEHKIIFAKRLNVSGNTSENRHRTG